jgi:hypothetical protein
MTLISARTTGVLTKISVTTGGSGYTSVPSVQLSGVPAGPGAPSAVAVMSGTRVDSVHISNPGYGLTQNPTVSFVGGGGSGAAATGYAYTGSLRPISFFKGRFNDLHGVDGMARGFRWNGTTVTPIGIAKPLSAPTVGVTAATTYSVDSVQLINEGAGYYSSPTVTFAGTAATTAKATAQVFNGRVINVKVTEPGSGYTSTPTVSFSGGIGSSAALTVGVSGRVASVEISDPGSGYTSDNTTNPSITFSTTGGLSGAAAEVLVGPLGTITGVNILSGGTGATTSIAGTISGGGGAGASVVVNMAYRVHSVGASTGGTGYYVPPVITVLPASGDSTGGGAAVTCSVSSGVVQSPLTVVAGGQYELPPTAVILDTQAEAMATIAGAMDGEYKCCYRYIDDTPVSQAGPRASSISDIKTVDGPGGTFSWSWSTTGKDDRATHVELWRTTAGQSVVFFRVATVPIGTTTYIDTLTDDQLKDTERDGYGLMPLTLPNGQINARRFEIPPAEFAVACMFQDRAWFALDVTGDKPNSLFYSEVDEPESVPLANELVVQENTQDADIIVGLIPFASQLLVAQQSHLYSLTYVAQPIIDASLRLVAYRGVLNNACWDVMGGVCFLVDSYGMYAFDGQSEQAVSTAVDNYWRDGIIDFSKADKFHVAADLQSKIVRFFYCASSDSEPTRALCYCIATKAWWEETYATAVTAECKAPIGNQMQPVFGTESGGLVRETGTSDSGTAIPYEFRTGAMPLSNEKGSRAIGIVYDPTSTTANLGLSLYYNNSSSARPNAVASDRGSGFVTQTGGTTATLDMAAARSPLGDSTGVARAYFAGRVDDRSAGADRHVAVGLGGTQPTTDQVVIRGVLIEGAG